MYVCRYVHVYVHLCMYVNEYACTLIYITIGKCIIVQPLNTTTKSLLAVDANTRNITLLVTANNQLWLRPKALFTLL